MNGTLWPAARVKGSVIPFKVNPAEAVAWVTLKLELPALLRVPDSVWLDPTFTLPKLKLEGEEARRPPFTPVALRLIESVAFEALLVMATVALVLPVADGLQATVTVVVCPPASVKGKVGETIWKSLPVTTMLLIVMLELPVLVTVSVSV